MANTYVYTGNPITPKFTLNIGERVLDSETDFDVEIRDNINVGTAHVTISGKGKFKGVIERTFEITPVPARSLSFFADVTEFVYTGEPCIMQVAVKFGDVTLQRGVDYEIEYVDNIEPGKANAVLYFSGNFYGTMTIPFTILAPEQTSDDEKTDVSLINDDYTSAYDAPFTASENVPEESEENDYDFSAKIDEQQSEAVSDVQDGTFANTSDVSHRKVTLGKKIRVYASAQGGEKPYSFAVYYKKLNSEKWIRISDYTDKTEFVIIPRKATIYQVLVRAKDGSGNISKKAFRISVSEKKANKETKSSADE